MCNLNPSHALIAVFLNRSTSSICKPAMHKACCLSQSTKTNAYGSYILLLLNPYVADLMPHCNDDIYDISHYHFIGALGGIHRMEHLSTAAISVTAIENLMDMP